MVKRAFTLIALTGTMLGALRAQTPRTLLENADRLYTEGKYQEAVESYEAVVGQGLHSAELHYNLGNAYFKAKNIPAAILSYERAHLLNPGDEDIQFNLDLARTYTVDKIEVLPEFFLVPFVRGIRDWLGSNAWAYLALASFALVLALTLFFWFSRSFSIRRYAFGVAILFSTLFVVSLAFSVSQKNRVAQRSGAIVFAPVISAKSSPDDSGKDLFILHAGTRVEMLRPLGEWCEIRIADGSKGWIPKTSIQKI